MDYYLKENLKLVFFIFLFIVCLWFLKMLFPVITLVIIAMLAVYLIAPLVEILVRLRIPQPFAAGLVFLFFLSVIFLFFYFIPPILFEQIRQLASYIATDFKQYVAFLFLQLEYLDQLLELNLVEQLTKGIISLIENIPAFLLKWSNNIYTNKVPLLGEIWSFLGLFFLIFFLLLDLDKIKTSLVNLFPSGYRHKVLHIISITDAKVGVYLRGNLVRCSLVGLATGSGLALLGMPFAFILGLTAGILNIIYNIGPFLAAIPAILLSLTPGTPHPLIVIGLYLVIQTIDTFVLTPFLMGKAVDLRPITILLAILCGARLLGILGIIIAIPVAAIAKVLINHYYLQRMP